MVDLYLLFKYVHVVAVIVWIGGVCTLTVINARLAREPDQAVVAALVRQSGFYGAAVIGPAAALTLIAGIATAASAGIPFSSLWISWGFTAILVSGLLGAVPIRLVTAQVGTLTALADPRDPRLTAARRWLTLLNALNLLVLLSAVWAMVAKPTL
jgi:uncharacterized membrane protein